MSVFAGYNLFGAFNWFATLFIWQYFRWQLKLKEKWIFSLLKILSYHVFPIKTYIVNDNYLAEVFTQGQFWPSCIKSKPPCIRGMELVSLSCNSVFISAESVGRGWCKIAIATKWYQFHTTDKCGLLFMPWITDQYTFVLYTKLGNKMGTAVAKVIKLSILKT